MKTEKRKVNYLNTKISKTKIFDKKDKKEEIKKILLIILVLLMFLFSIISYFLGYILGKIDVVPFFEKIADGTENKTDDTVQNNTIINNNYNSQNKNNLQNTNNSNKNENTKQDDIQNNKQVNKVIDTIKITEDDIEWNVEKKLNVFSNPQYYYKSIIVPTTENYYQFMVENSTDTPIKYNIVVLQ
ncbi:MAG: hypothetical protein Q4G09_06845 [Clostridia bacterium]|nr:hypothetical protein [Clostridia bacterium]